MPANGSSRTPPPARKSSAGAAKPGTAKPGNAKSGTAKPGNATAGTTTAGTTTAGATTAGTTKAAAAKSGTAAKASRRGATAQRSPGGRPGSGRTQAKSIVSKQQRPWGLIITSIVVLVFAVGVIAFALTRHKTPKTSANDQYALPEVAAAKAISGIKFKVEPNHAHVAKTVNFDTTPPIGGDHSYVWADCTGTAYPQPIANENAVHALEHGAVWITYRPGLDATSIKTLSALVVGQNYTLMSPYDGLKKPISLQAWGYQLFVGNASDTRIKQFIDALRNNKSVSPEYPGACSQPTFKKSPSTPGHPIFPPTS